MHSDQAGGAFGLVHSGNGAFSPAPHFSMMQVKFLPPLVIFMDFHISVNNKMFLYLLYVYVRSNKIIFKKNNCHSLSEM